MFFSDLEPWNPPQANTLLLLQTFKGHLHSGRSLTPSYLQSMHQILVQLSSEIRFRAFCLGPVTDFSVKNQILHNFTCFALACNVNICSHLLCITAEVLYIITPLEKDCLKDKATSSKFLFVLVPIYL